MIPSGLAKNLIPYLELMRLDKPAGFLYLYLPSMAATSVAALMSEPEVSSSEFVVTNLLLLLSSVLMRGAGCSWNDLLDRKLDQQISRTRNRPLARGAITPFNALVCTIVQVLLFIEVQSRLPVSAARPEVISCTLVSLHFLVATAIYPITKRITDYPQVFLTIPSAWGIFIASPALGIDALSSPACTLAMICLLASNTAWTISYDLVYAFQDIKDDRKAGIRSIAVKHADQARYILMGLGVLQSVWLLTTCTLIGGGPICFFGAATCVISLITMISQVDLGDPADCAWWFKFGCLFAGATSSVAFCCEYVIQRLSM